MAIKLLSEHLIKILHIALFTLISLLGFQAEAQSILLPGDVAVVSVNASNNTVDLVPLIDVEEGTEIYLSAGKWDASTNVLTGTEASLRFLNPVQAGSIIHINGKGTENYEFNGRLPFRRTQNQFYVYQKDENVYRFIYGLNFGSVSEDAEMLATEIPPVLNETENSFVQLGVKPNHQYFIKNGASGTQNMILQFLGEASNWKSSDTPISPFGVSFNVLKPPVVMFENTYSSYLEGDSTAALQVSIFEHDGSRISVDVAFEASQSSADTMDFSGYKTQTLNFTGLVGTYTTKVPIPVAEDANFEGREGGIFYLTNLTDGSLGDFISHNVMVEDKKVPNLVISDVSNKGERGSYVEISNLENSEVSVKGWVLETNNFTLGIDSSLVIGPYKKLRIFDGSGEDFTEGPVHLYNLKGLTRSLTVGDGGLLSLKNYNSKIIHQVGFRNSGSEQNNAIVADNSKNNDENDRVVRSGDTAVSSVQSSVGGWNLTSMKSETAATLSQDMKLLIWDDQTKTFNSPETLAESNGNVLVLGDYGDTELQKLKDNEVQLRAKSSNDNSVMVKLSAVDLDENDVINGAEGMNLITLPFDEEIPVGVLRNLISDKIESSTNTFEFFEQAKGAQGLLDFRSLSNKEKLTPGSIYILRIKNEMEPKDIEISKGELSSAISEFDETVNLNDIDTGSVTLKLKSGQFEQEINLMIDPENLVENKTDLNSLSGFLPDSYSPFSFSAIQGDEYFEVVSIPESAEQVISMPLSFGGSTNDSYTLSVTKWENIPSGWTVKLLDRFNDKEYDLRSDFTLNFDHTFSESDGSRNTERFEVQVYPEVANQQAEESLSDVPKEIELNQNYPNPFNPVTTISFYLPESRDVKLSIFNIVGQPVAVLFEGRLSSGRQQFEWDATDKPSGMYIYQLEVGDKVMTRKMTLVK